MEGPPLGPGGEDITWPDQVAPWGRGASSTRKIRPQTSNLKPPRGVQHCPHRGHSCRANRSRVLKRPRTIRPSTQLGAPRLSANIGKQLTRSR